MLMTKKTQVKVKLDIYSESYIDQARISASWMDQFILFLLSEGYPSSNLSIFQQNQFIKI